MFTRVEHDVVTFLQTRQFQRGRQPCVTPYFQLVRFCLLYVVSEVDSGLLQERRQVPMQREFRCRDGVFMCEADVPQIGITQILKIHTSNP